MSPLNTIVSSENYRLNEQKTQDNGRITEMESEDFKAKRINYLNNWPNVEPFEIEKKYYFLIKNLLKKLQKCSFFWYYSL